MVVKWQQSIWCCGTWEFCHITYIIFWIQTSLHMCLSPRISRSHSSWHKMMDGQPAGDICLLRVDMLRFLLRLGVSWPILNRHGLTLLICVFTSEFPAQRPVTHSFDLRPNKCCAKLWGWCFEMPSRSLWRHRNALGNSPGLINCQNLDTFFLGPLLSTGINLNFSIDDHMPS